MRRMRTPRGQEARARDRIRGSIIPSSLGIDRAERSSERPVESADESGPQPASLPAFFEASVDLGPDRPAVIVGDQHTTYAELEARANQLARYLLARGIGRGSRVAILLDRSVDLYVAILGTLKSGAAYVPLDPGYPADRVGFVVEDAGVRAVLTTSERVSSYATKIPTILLDVEAPRIQRESPTRPGPSEADVGPEDLCYIIYTSGSTGRPKGVAVEHRNITHWVQAARTVYGITAEDRVYQGFSVAFDASLEEIWMAWANGAALVPATPEMSRAGPDLPKLLAAAGVTFLSTVPTLASMFTDDIPSVRLLVFGGERCPDATAHRWCRPGRRVLNTYGPTEATVTATYAECRPGEPVTIGRAMPGYELYVLDESLQPVAAGEAGELCIGGPGLARGYLNRDDLTRQRFVPNPIASDRADVPRIYRTGDLVRATESGDLQFLGRADDQVKIRGYRVELSEIEAQLMTVPGVRAAAVALRELTP